MITSWIDWQNTDPKNPMDLIANASWNSVVGAYSNSTNFINNGAGYVSNAWSIAASPSVAALETDNLQRVADANQWNFQHVMLNPATIAVPPLSKVIFLRGGTRWVNSMGITLNGVGPFTDFQLSFRDNAGTRGDQTGTVPVISWPASVVAATVIMTVTLKELSGRANMILSATDNNGKRSAFEMEWIIVP